VPWTFKKSQKRPSSPRQVRPIELNNLSSSFRDDVKGRETQTNNYYYTNETENKTKRKETNKTRKKREKKRIRVQNNKSRIHILLNI
jgi:hypothetical protein